jgi:two-component system, OmpR family, response regulator TctD
MQILLVETNRPLARSLQTGLAEEGFSVQALHDPQGALDLLRSQPFAVVIVDIPPGRETGLLQSWRQARISTPVLVLSSPGSSLEKFHENGLGPGAFLAKPFSFDELLQRLATLTNDH